MAENEGAVQGGEQANGGNIAPQVGVVAQYVKDFSFENPGAPDSLRGRQMSPQIGITVNVRPNPIEGSDSDLEVELAIEARATEGEAVLFAIELVYAGIFRFTNVPQENVPPIAMRV